MFILAQMPAAQLPPLPEGPSLDSVRGPIEAANGFETWQIALAVLAVGIIAGLLMWLLLRSRGNAGPRLTAEETALAELEAANCSEDDTRFALLSANAVRRYLGTRFRLPATSLTSKELYIYLPLYEATRVTIRDYLERCDGVKFAGQQLSPESRIQLFDTAKNIITSQERREPPPL